MTNEEALTEIQRIAKEPYSEENHKKYKEVMMNIERWIFLADEHIYNLPRNSDEFKKLTEHHTKAMKEDPVYFKCYYDVIDHCVNK